MSALSDAIAKLQNDVAAHKTAVDAAIAAAASDAPTAADLRALEDLSTQIEAHTAALTPASAEESPAA